MNKKYKKLMEEFEEVFGKRPAEPSNDLESPTQWADIVFWQDEFIEFIFKKWI